MKKWMEGVYVPKSQTFRMWLPNDQSSGSGCKLPYVYIILCGLVIYMHVLLDLLIDAGS